MSTLYRYYDKNNVLLYVGISVNAVYRFTQHKNKSSWVDDIERIEIEKFESKKEASEAEVKAIRNEKPLYNVIHQGDSEDFIQATTGPSYMCKEYGLKSLAELSRISDVSVQTLINWSNDKPKLFLLVIKGAAEHKKVK